MTVPWDLTPGDEIRRKALHDRYGGSRQGGIAPSGHTPNVMVFSDAASGNQHGYFDRWEGDLFLYCGEGQEGDQKLDRGNRAILMHHEGAKALRVFQGARGTVQYVGEFEVDDAEPWAWEVAPDTAGSQRRVIMFRLRPVGSTLQHGPGQTSATPAILGAPYIQADEDVATRARDDVVVDPDAVDRALRGHRRTQNLVASWARAEGYEPRRPRPGEPGFDVAWDTGSYVAVVEVKSLRGGLPSNGQLRLGLGQVLDYADQLEAMGKEVRPILAVESEPDRRWIRVCARAGVILVWPDELDRMK